VFITFTSEDEDEYSTQQFPPLLQAYSDAELKNYLLLDGVFPSLSNILFLVFVYPSCLLRVYKEEKKAIIIIIIIIIMACLFLILYKLQHFVMPIEISTYSRKNLRADNIRGSFATSQFRIYHLPVVNNRKGKRNFGHETEKVNKGWRKVHNEKLCNFFTFA
jgi:hypothetical protein